MHATLLPCSRDAVGYRCRTCVFEVHYTPRVGAVDASVSVPLFSPCWGISSAICSATCHLAHKPPSTTTAPPGRPPARAQTTLYRLSQSVRSVQTSVNDAIDRRLSLQPKQRAGPCTEQGSRPVYIRRSAPVPCGQCPSRSCFTSWLAASQFMLAGQTSSSCAPVGQTSRKDLVKYRERLCRMPRNGLEGKDWDCIC